MLSFERPAALLLLAAAFAYGLWYRSARRRGRLGYALPLLPWGGKPDVSAPLAPRLAYYLCAALGAAAYLAVALAAAGPVRTEPVAAAGRPAVDIVFAIDLSPSMAAMDVEPTRLAAAVRSVGELLDRGVGQAAVGLVGFGDAAVLLAPPTTDYDFVRFALGAVEPGSYGEATAIGQGLALALRHVLAGSAPRKALMLLSDGEDNVGLVHPGDAAAAAARYGVELVVVGVGSQGDAPIAYRDPKSGERLEGFYRSEFNEAALKALAVAGGGIYLPAGDAKGLARALDQAGAAVGVGPDERKPSRLRRVYLDRYFAGLALACMALSYALRRFALGGIL